MFNLQVFFFQKLVAALLVWNLSFCREQLLFQNFNNHRLSWAFWASWSIQDSWYRLSLGIAPDRCVLQHFLRLTKLDSILLINPIICLCNWEILLQVTATWRQVSPGILSPISFFPCHIKNLCLVIFIILCRQILVLDRCWLLALVGFTVLYRSYLFSEAARVHSLDISMRHFRVIVLDLYRLGGA